MLSQVAESVSYPVSRHDEVKQVRHVKPQGGSVLRIRSQSQDRRVEKSRSSQVGSAHVEWWCWWGTVPRTRCKLES